MKRIFWIVLDSAGIGEAPDADRMQISLVMSEVIHGRAAMTAGNFIFRIWKR